MMSEWEHHVQSRPPLMEINASSQNSLSPTLAVDGSKLPKVPSTVIDLSCDTDPIECNTNSEPIAQGKGKKPSVPKPRAPAKKAATTGSGKSAAAKKVKKTKSELEFDKLSPKEMIEFLSARVSMIGELQMKLQREEEGAAAGEESAPIADDVPASSTTTDENQLCNLRLELGSVLSQEAELRARERRLRLGIKRLQRKITLAQSPIVCREREVQPMGLVAQKLFATTDTRDTTSSASCEVTSIREYHSVTVLWSLAQHTEHFDSIAAPRLLDVERDATLRDINTTATTESSSLPAPSSSSATSRAESRNIESEDADVSAAAPLCESKNCMLPQSPTTAPSKPVEESAVESISVDTVQVSNMLLQSCNTVMCIPGTENITMSADIYDVIDDPSSSDSVQPEETSSTTTNAPAEPVAPLVSSALPTNEEPTDQEKSSTLTENTVTTTGMEAKSSDFTQLFRQFEYRENADLTSLHPSKRPKMSTTETEGELAVPPVATATSAPRDSSDGDEAHDAPALTAPSAAAEVQCIDLTSPELVPVDMPKRLPASRGTAGDPPTTAAPVSIDLVSLSGSSVGESQSQSQSQLQPQHPAHSQPQLVTVGSVAPPTTSMKKTVGTTGVAESSQVYHQAGSQQPAGVPSAPEKSAAESVGESFGSSEGTPDLGCVIHYVPAGQQRQSQCSQASGAPGSCSPPVDPSAALTKEAPPGAPAPLAADANADSQHSSSDRSTTSEEIRNILDSSEEPDFASMPVQKLRDIVLHYGLRVDSKGRMVSLLRAMWMRLHPAAEGATATTAVATTITAPATAVRASLKLGAASGTTKKANSIVRAVAAPAPLKRPASQASEAGASTEAPAKKARKPTASSQLSQLSQTTSSNISTGAGTARVAPKRELTAAELSDFIKSRPEWYEQVLCYVPLDLDKLHAAILSDLGGEAKVTKARLLELLDEMAVFVSASVNARQHKKGSKPRRTQSQQGP